MKLILKKSKLLAFLLIVFMSWQLLTSTAYSQTPTPTPTPSVDTSALQQQILQYEQKISDLKGQEQTLSSQISIMDSQIKLTEYKIAATEAQITGLTLDIDTASKKITTLQSALNSSIAILLNRIVATYEVGTIQPIQVLLTSGNASDFLQRLNYLKLAQAHDRKLIYDTQQAKVDYANQKNIFENEKKQVEALNQQLQALSDQLGQQKVDKQKLLSETKGSEANYQQLLSQAKAQLAAFSGFVQSQGGVDLISADPSWPSDYFSQRDTRWGNVTIAGYYASGAIAYTIGQAGCLISSVAMVVTHRGNSTTPLSIGTNGSYFFDSNFLWSGLTSLGFNSPQRTTNTSTIDNYLSQGKWVIVGISYSSSLSSSPFHFVVVTGKNGNDYNLYDPWRGPNVSFNNNYGSNYITEVISY